MLSFKWTLIGHEACFPIARFFVAKIAQIARAWALIASTYIFWFRTRVISFTRVWVSRR